MSKTKIPSVSDINLALVAQGKRKEGQKLEKREKEAISAFRNLYADAVEIKANPTLATALGNALEYSAPGSFDIPDNPLLTQHLKKLREQGCASDGEINQIANLAQHLSEDEDDAISATLAELTLKGSVSDAAVLNVKSYLDQARVARTKFVTSRKAGSVALKVGAAAATAAALPLLFWVTPLGGALATMSGGAASAVKLGTIGSGAVGGTILGTILGRGLDKAAANYGVRD